MLVKLNCGALCLCVDRFDWSDVTIGLEFKYSDKCLMSDEEFVSLLL